MVLKLNHIFSYFLLKENKMCILNIFKYFQYNNSEINILVYTRHCISYKTQTF